MLTDPHKALENLHSGLISPSASVRFDAIHDVRQRPTPDALRPFIYLAVNDGNDDVRREASWGIGKLIRAGVVKTQEVYTLLMRFVTDQEANKRAYSL